MNKRILKTILAIGIISVLLNNNLIFAAFADYDDNTAAKETQNILLEQQKEAENSAGKSTNNYLSVLEVKGYKITPEFDKQTLSYSISEEVKESNIEIIAVADDERATIQGIGTIELQPGENNIRIDVESESGTVRTYFIKALTKSGGKTDNNIDNTNNEIIDVSTNIINEEKSLKNSKLINYIILLIILITILIIILNIAKKGKSKKKSKHHK